MYSCFGFQSGTAVKLEETLSQLAESRKQNENLKAERKKLEEHVQLQQEAIDKLEHNQWIAAKTTARRRTTAIFMAMASLAALYSATVLSITILSPLTALMGLLGLMGARVLLSLPIESKMSMNGAHGSDDSLRHRRERRSTSLPKLASEMEMKVIEKVKGGLLANPPKNIELPNAPLMNVQVLRFIREHGTNVKKIEKCYRNALLWKHKNLPPNKPTNGQWRSSAEMPHGEWATKFLVIGMHIGYSKEGNPVKLERLGQFDTKNITKESDWRKRSYDYYRGLVDFLQQRLDEMSVEQNILQQSYEIFDLEGLNLGMLNLTSINFTKDVLIAFATHYPSSFRKCAVINAPEFIPRIWSIFAAVLPESVKAKIRFLGKDYEHELSKDLPPETMALLTCTNHELVHNAERRE